MSLNVSSASLLLRDFFLLLKWVKDRDANSEMWMLFLHAVENIIFFDKVMKEYVIKM